MTETSMQFCPYCGQNIDLAYSFCPHCGKSLEILRGIGIGKQIYVYFVSLFLPPFGIVYTFNYIKSPNSKVKAIGIVALILTVISLVVTVWMIFNITGQVQTAVNKYSNLNY